MIIKEVKMGKEVMYIGGVVLLIVLIWLVISHFNQQAEISNLKNVVDVLGSMILR